MDGDGLGLAVKEVEANDKILEGEDRVDLCCRGGGFPETIHLNAMDRIDAPVEREGGRDREGERERER